MTITELAPAKLNLALHIRRRRADGYHELETLFVFCRDGDVITVRAADQDSFAITGPFAAGLAKHDNLVTRAAAAFVAAFARGARHAITLDKRLPIASGIGGGSADAAATLRALARLHGVPANEPGLFAIAAELGSDVPACLLGRPCLGTGRGDDLQPVDGLGERPVLLVNPGVLVSTPAVFGQCDGVDRGGVATGDPWAAALAGRNDLEAPALALAPVVGEALAQLRETGPLLARMSGSGATCFAVYADEAARDAAAAMVAAAQPGWWRLSTRVGDN